MNCIMVYHNQGTFQLNGAATTEDWDEVQAAIEDMRYVAERHCDLTGWGEYTACYRLHHESDERKPDLYYFVAEEA